MPYYKGIDTSLPPPTFPRPPTPPPTMADILEARRRVQEEYIDQPGVQAQLNEVIGAKASNILEGQREQRRQRLRERDDEYKKSKQAIEDEDRRKWEAYKASYDASNPTLKAIGDDLSKDDISFFDDEFPTMSYEGDKPSILRNTGDIDTALPPYLRGLASGLAPELPEEKTTIRTTAAPEQPPTLRPASPASSPASSRSTTPAPSRATSPVPSPASSRSTTPVPSSSSSDDDEEEVFLVPLPKDFKKALKNMKRIRQDMIRAGQDMGMSQDTTIRTIEGPEAPPSLSAPVTVPQEAAPETAQALPIPDYTVKKIPPSTRAEEIFQILRKPKPKTPVEDIPQELTPRTNIVSERFASAADIRRLMANVRPLITTNPQTGEPIPLGATARTDYELGFAPLPAPNTETAIVPYTPPRTGTFRNLLANIRGTPTGVLGGIGGIIGAIAGIEGGGDAGTGAAIGNFVGSMLGAGTGAGSGGGSATNTNTVVDRATREAGKAIVRYFKNKTEDEKLQKSLDVALKTLDDTADAEEQQAQFAEDAIARQMFYNTKAFTDYRRIMEERMSRDIGTMRAEFAARGVSLRDDSPYRVEERIRGDAEAQIRMAQNQMMYNNYELLMKKDTEIAFYRKASQINKDTAKNNYLQQVQNVRQQNNLNIMGDFVQNAIYVGTGVDLSNVIGSGRKRRKQAVEA